MKRLLHLIPLLWLLITSASPAATAQDTLITVQGEELYVKLLEVHPELVRYRQAGKPDSVVQQLEKSKLFMIKYGNGTREVIWKEQPAAGAAPATVSAQGLPVALQGLTEQQQYEKGRIEAIRYYKPKAMGVAGTCATLFNPIAGVILAAVVSPGKIKIHQVSDPALLQSRAFTDGYNAEAKRIIRRKTWAGVAVGGGIYVLYFYALFASMGGR